MFYGSINGLSVIPALVWPMWTPQLLDSLVSWPGQLDGQMNPASLIGHSGVRMEGDTGARSIGNDGHQLAAAHEIITLWGMKEYKEKTKIRYGNMVTLS